MKLIVCTFLFLCWLYANLHELICFYATFKFVIVCFFVFLWTHYQELPKLPTLTIFENGETLPFESFMTCYLFPEINQALVVKPEIGWFSINHTSIGKEFTILENFKEHSVFLNLFFFSFFC